MEASLSSEVIPSGVLVTWQNTTELVACAIRGITQRWDAHLSLALGSADQQDFSCSFNLRDLNARFRLKSQLASYYPKAKLPWDSVLNAICREAEATWLSAADAICCSQLPSDPDDSPFLLKPLLVAQAPTIFFGDGGSGKSYLSLTLALALARGTPWAPSFPSQPSTVLYLDYEASPVTFKRRLLRLTSSLKCPLPENRLFYLSGRGIPLASQTDALRRICQSHKITCLFCDSIGPALGGNPNDTELALAYFSAIASLNLTSVHIAHISKADRQTADKPFGSAFFHNEARATWLINRQQDPDSDSISLALLPKKANDGPLPNPIGLKLSFAKDQGPVSYRLISLPDSPDISPQLSLKDEITLALSKGPLSVSDLALLLSRKPGSCRGTLLRHRGDAFTQLPNPASPKIPLWANLAPSQDA